MDAKETPLDMDLCQTCKEYKRPRKSMDERNKNLGLEEELLKYTPLPRVINHLVQHKTVYEDHKIYATSKAFMYIKDNKYVLTWGQKTAGAKISPEIVNKLEEMRLEKEGTERYEDSKYIKAVETNTRAIALVLADNQVLAWGDGECGGEMSSEVKEILKTSPIIENICSTDGEFAILYKKEGEDKKKVVSWGLPKWKRQENKARKTVKDRDVAKMFSNDMDFMALIENEDKILEEIIIWGYHAGEIIDTRQKYPQLQQEKMKVKNIYCTKDKFAILMDDDMTLILSGETHSEITDYLENNIKKKGKNSKIQQISSNRNYFAVLMEDKTLLLWGEFERSIVQNNATHIVTGDYTPWYQLDNGKAYYWKDGWQERHSTLEETNQKIKHIETLLVQHDVALLEDGSLLDLSEGYSKALSELKEEMSKKETLKVLCLCSTQKLFVALLSNGKIWVWNDTGGRTNKSRINKLVESEKVKQIVANEGAVALLMDNGDLRVFGEKKFGGNNNKLQEKIKQFEDEIQGKGKKK